MLTNLLSGIPPRNKNQIILGVTLVLTLFFALLVWGVFVVTTPNDPKIEPSFMNRFAQILGGSMPMGLIQVATFGFFTYGLLTLLYQKGRLVREWEAFRLGLLPTTDQKIIKPEQVQEYKLKMIELEREGHDHQLIGIIKRVCTQYRNEGSISDTLQVLDAQIETSRDENQISYGILEYLSPGVSSLGFLGTVLGISAAIGKFDLAKTDEGLKQITSDLYVAFDTTFFALALGILLSYYYNRAQDDETALFASIKRYVIDNLISRIYHGGVGKS